VRAAWDWAVSQGRIGDMDRSMASLAEFYHVRAWFHEGAAAFGRAARRLAGKQADIGSRLETSRPSALLLGRVLARQGWFCDYLGLVEQASELLRESLDILSELGARRETAYALLYLGGVYAELGKPQYQEALDIFREIGDRRGIALALRHLGWGAIVQGEYGAARQLLQESLTLFRELGHPQGIAESLGSLGYVTWALGEYGEAQRLHWESHALFRDIGDPQGIASSLACLARDACGLEEYAEGRRLYRESLAQFRDTGGLAGTAMVLGDLSEVANVLGEYAEATRLAQESLALDEKLGYPREKAWAFRVLGNAACGRRDFQGARTYLRQALEIGMSVRAIAAALLTVVGIADLLAREGKREWAVELLALILHHPSTWQWTKDRAAPLVAELKTALSPDLFAAAQERGRARDLWATAQELLAELSSS
jgi:tetratricopeptide (TPR) repeat protein